MNGTTTMARKSASVTITPRNVTFSREQRHKRWYHGGDPIATNLFNALSLTFPEGEAYFVKSVRHYLEELPEPLRTEVAQFAQQEAFHSREHMAFNRQVADAGYELTEINALLREDTQKTKDEPPEVHLASTAALEHFTALLAHALLRDKRHLEGCPEEVRQLWQWHSIEEIEHKAVAFDTFMYVTRDMSPFKRWLFRVMVMWHASIDFYKERKRDLHLLFQQDGIDTPKTWRKLAWYLMAKPGLLRQIAIPYFSYYLPGFHPWKHDDRALAKKVEQNLKLPTAA